MRARLMNIVQKMWQRSKTTQSTSHAPFNAYIEEVRKLQRDGFYPVHVGKTEFFEKHIIEDVHPGTARFKNEPVWSIIHAGGALGWVPWNYKLNFHFSGTKLKPDKEIFHELCSELNENYGKCAIIVNPPEFSQNERSEKSIYPSSPVELLPMTCCPEMAQNSGHKMLQLPPQAAHKSPLSIAWTAAKWFMITHKIFLTQSHLHADGIQQFINLNDVIDGALSMMTQCKWADAMKKELDS